MCIPWSKRDRERVPYPRPLSFDLEVLRCGRIMLLRNGGNKYEARFNTTRESIVERYAHVIALV